MLKLFKQENRECEWRVLYGLKASLIFLFIPSRTSPCVLRLTKTKAGAKKSCLMSQPKFWAVYNINYNFGDIIKALVYVGAKNVKRNK